MTKYLGGCLCNSVRYTLTSEPQWVGACHCRNCQKQAGTAFSVVMAVPRDSVSIEGELSTYVDHSDAGTEVLRKFCGKCGSPVFTDTAMAEARGIIFIKTGSLDDTKGFVPSMHFWTQSKQDWVPISEGQKIIEKQ